MLDKKYGLNYSMPHSVVHIVDNSMYTGDLPVTVVDDPSLLATIVVTGSPMGEDRHVVAVNRSDVLDVAYGMRNLTTADIEKYGQTITYPSALIAQDVPVKLLRVTPDDATYAFSCMLIQWRWGEDYSMHVRFVTTSGNGNNGLPLGVIHSNFKNTKKLNDTLVLSFKENEVVDEDGNKWKQRVFMTNIAAGRGSAYNDFSFSINAMQAKNHPANARYNFITFNTLTDQIYESFEASLINQNNGMRLDATDSVNVAVSKRLAGSSILVPTVNEAAIKELYDDYMSNMKDMIDEKIDPVSGTVDWAEVVYKTLNINIFDPIYGLYIYNGDTDVELPYFQVEMYKSDIPKLSEANRLVVYLDDGPSVVSDYLANPTILNEKLNALTYGIGAHDGDMNKYHVGDVFLSKKNTSCGISLITSINQYTGAVTTIPLNKVKTFTDADISESGDDVIRVYVSIDKDPKSSDGKDAIKNALKSLIETNKFTPRGTVNPSTGVTSYAPDYIGVEITNAQDSVTTLNTFAIAKVEYNDKPGESTGKPEISGVTSVRSTAAELYPVFVYPSTTVVSFATNKNDEYFSVPGSTVIVTSNDTAFGGKSIGTVYVNGYNRDGEGAIIDKYDVVSPYPFKVGNPPTSVPVPEGDKTILGNSYDVIVYQDTGSSMTWTVTGGTPVATNESAEITGYANGDIVKFDGISSAFKYVVGDTTSLTTVAAVGQTGAEVKPKKYAAASRYTAVSDPYTVVTFSGSGTEQDPYLPAYDSGTYYTKENGIYTLLTSAPDNWGAADTFYTTDFNSSTYKVLNKITGEMVAAEAGLAWEADTFYEDGELGVNLSIKLEVNNINVTVPEGTVPTVIQRYVVAGTSGTLYRYAQNPMFIPPNYYSDSYGINPSSEEGGIPVEGGSSGFFDDKTISDIEFKWKYSELLVKAYKGEIDPRIMSPQRCPAKFLFDGATNTIVGQTILPYMTYKPIDIINASTIFTEEEKEACSLDASLTKNLSGVDIDVKQAMYDFMVYRCYYGMPEDKRPLGPGYGLALHLDSGVTDANTAMLVNQSFAKRFNNPNASWDIGGYTSTVDGVTYTYTQRIVSNMFRVIKNNSINKPFAGVLSNIAPNEYSSFFPDIDASDWELRQLFYKSGGNAWIMDTNGNLQRKSQKSLYRENETSDLVQENNMRTLSQLCYLLQNKIDSYLLAYNDDGVLKTLKDECDNMFSNWVGDLVTALDITFKRDIDPNDGGEIVVCYVKVTFRGLILRVPIIVNVQRRLTNT